MSYPSRRSRRRPSVHRRLLATSGEEPLSGVANLFDTAMVFSVGLLLALVTYYSLPELLTAKDVALVKNPGTPEMEIIRRKGKKLERYKMTLRTLEGEGVRLGTAYRLKNGDVVYVPDLGAEGSKATGEPARP